MRRSVPFLFCVCSGQFVDGLCFGKINWLKRSCAVKQNKYHRSTLCIVSSFFFSYIFSFWCQSSWMLFLNNYFCICSFRFTVCQRVGRSRIRMDFKSFNRFNIKIGNYSSVLPYRIEFIGLCVIFQCITTLRVHFILFARMVLLSSDNGMTCARQFARFLNIRPCPYSFLYSVILSYCNCVVGKKITNNILHSRHLNTLL